jgi:two-component system chemotaxis response regulator CheB
LDAAVFVVMHFPENSTSVLPQILNRLGTLTAEHATNGQAIQSGRIYTAPPGHHMLVKNGYIRLTNGPKENSHRPAIDPLFRSAAKAYGARCAGVLLSGLLDDGSLGMAYVKRHGGATFLQDPEEALFDAMIRNAMTHVEVDRILPTCGIAECLAEAASRPSEPLPVHPADNDLDPVELDSNELRRLEQFEKPSTFTCPECSGTLFELNDNGVTHYRCRVGHAYNPETLQAEQLEQLEAGLWQALRALEESVSLSRRLLERATSRGQARSTKYHEERLEENLGRVEILKRVLDEVGRPAFSRAFLMSTHTGADVEE